MELTASSVRSCLASAFGSSSCLAFGFVLQFPGTAESFSHDNIHFHACGVSVFDHILQRMREKVRALDYVMTIHAEEEMEDDDLSILGVEQTILIGEIIERQHDQETREWKYLIAGNTLADEPLIVVAKLALTGNLVLITVYCIE
jgi:hypothetical protein